LIFRRGSVNLEIIKTPAVPKFAPKCANFPDFKMMNSNAITVVETDWKLMLGDWSYEDFKCNDLLVVLVPHLLKEFPTIELFNKNYNSIYNILISRLSPKNADDWKRAKNNLGQKNKKEEDNFSSQRKRIKRILDNQMTKLEGHMFQAVIVDSWDTEKHFDTDSENESEVNGKVTKKRKTSGKNKNGTSTSTKKQPGTKKSSILDEDYDGSYMFGTKVCKYFKKVKGSNHKAAFYDGEIVDYNKA
jgi:hypothetical protein